MGGWKARRDGRGMVRVHELEVRGRLRRLDVKREAGRDGERSRAYRLCPYGELGYVVQTFRRLGVEFSEVRYTRATRRGGSSET